MAALLFISITGITMNLNICKGGLTNSCLLDKEVTCSTIPGKSDNCERMKSCCNPDKDDKDCKKGCCDQKSFKVQVDQDFLVQHSDRSELKIQKSFVIAYAVTFFALSDQDFTLIKHSESDIPPPLVENKQVLHQSFLL